MKTVCAIIKDLLPLYHDEVCSEESRALVEQHLSECEECRSELKEMDKVLASPASTEEAKPLEHIAKAWKQDKAKAFAKGFSLASALLSIACIVAYNVIGAKVLEDGTLVEPFGLIPLAYLFALITLISTIILFIITKRTSKKFK